MYHTILAAMGENYEDSAVLDTAIFFARSFRAKLILCHVQADESHSEFPHTLEELTLAIRVSELFSVDCQVLAADQKSIPETLARAALEHNADVVIVGAKCSGEERSFSNSVGERLMHKLTCSILFAYPPKKA